MIKKETTGRVKRYNKAHLDVKTKD